ncbi:MAG: rhomboid family intramembrane serine protease [Gammaproteobacteria bacterium]
MVFFPYKAQIKLTKIPVVTILISLLCLAVYIEQSRNERALFKQTAEFCTAKVAGQIELIADRYLSDLQSWPCEYILLDVYARPRPSKYLDELIQEIDSPYDEVFREHYDRFSDVALTYVTASLWQERPSWNIGRMLTGSIAHGSWEHLIFNLVFFFAFAATVELLIGPVLFLGACLGLAIGIGCIDTLVHLGSSEVTATVGLSGVVMGMLGLFAFFVPRVKIRFFYWFLIFVGTVGIPAWAVAAWYIGWDMYYQITQTGGMTNLVAHLAGAALGFGIGFVVFREKRHWARELVIEEMDSTKDATLGQKLSAAISLPGLVVLAVLGLVIFVTLIVMFVTSFWVQLLLAAPIGVAVWRLYGMRDAAGLDAGRYKKGMEAIDLGEHKKAVEYLQPLAEKGHPRAQFALGNIHGAHWGATKNETKTVYWYEQASKRNHAEAQYMLGIRYADGRGVPADPAKAIELYRKAAAHGFADAAFSLGFVYETGKGIEPDKDEAARWYEQAGRLCLKAGRLEDTEMAIASLNGLIPEHPLGAQLRRLMQAQSRVVAKPQSG